MGWHLATAIIMQPGMHTYKYTCAGICYMVVLCVLLKSDCIRRMTFTVRTHTYTFQFITNQISMFKIVE